MYQNSGWDQGNGGYGNSNPYGNNSGNLAQRSPMPSPHPSAAPSPNPYGDAGGAAHSGGWGGHNSAPPANEMQNMNHAYSGDGSKSRSGSRMSAVGIHGEHRAVLGQLFKLTPAVGAVYALMGMVAFAGFFFISDGELSAILVLASLLTCMSHMFVLLEVVITKSTESVNVPSQILLAVVYATRLPALIWADQYLPVDSTGDWAYQFFEAASCVGACLTIYLAMYTYKKPLNFNEEPPATGPVPWWVALPVAALIAFFFPCMRIRKFYLDWGWTFSCYLEAFARVPQVMQVATANNPVAPNVGHSLVLMFFARLFTFWFYWNYSSAYKINKAGSSVVFLICSSQLAQLFLLIDFVYCYVKHILRSGFQFQNEGISIHHQV